MDLNSQQTFFLELLQKQFGQNIKYSEQLDEFNIRLDKIEKDNIELKEKILQQETLKKAIEYITKENKSMKKELEKIKTQITVNQMMLRSKRRN